MRAHEKFKFSIQLTLPAILTILFKLLYKDHIVSLYKIISYLVSHMCIIECYAIENKLRKVYTVYVSQNNQQKHWLCDFEYTYLFLLF